MARAGRRNRGAPSRLLRPCGQDLAGAAVRSGLGQVGGRSKEEEEEEEGRRKKEEGVGAGGETSVASRRMCQRTGSLTLDVSDRGRGQWPVGSSGRLGGSRGGHPEAWGIGTVACHCVVSRGSACVAMSSPARRADRKLGNVSRPAERSRLASPPRAPRPSCQQTRLPRISS
ncbi:hypothetical protein BC628DRAFT_1073712 [Trametes gibbosa]|nr:hypothetical protein BC628DRAFT_1073712 [Trametes gibbosa]